MTTPNAGETVEPDPTMALMLGLGAWKMYHEGRLPHTKKTMYGVELQSCVPDCLACIVEKFITDEALHAKRAADARGETGE